MIFTVSVLLVLAACSPKKGNSVMKFFFDGVPEKRQKDSLNIVSASDLSPKEIGQKKNNADSINFFYHPPFKDKACNTCHRPGEPGSMAHNQSEVCFSCHQNFNIKYSYLHGPVAAGECTTCHFPHVAENKNLLRRNGQNICLYCHQQSLVMQNAVHTNIGNSSCLSCHNPHGGRDRFLIVSK